MRTLQRNRREIWYALYSGVTDVVDDDGYKTGETDVTYETPVKTFMNVSGGRGVAEAQFFGIENPFTRVAVTDDMTTAFNTDTVFWFEKTPGEDMDDYNYVCTGVVTTINGRVIALKEVDVTDGGPHVSV